MGGSTLHGGEHAIVVGASMSGLIAARVLSDHFARVTLIERDRLPVGFAPRKGVPQGRHVHGLLARGQRILQDLFPGLVEDLIADGAVQGDICLDTLFFQYGGYKTRFESGHRGLLMSRPLIEGRVRRRVLGLVNVTLVEECDVLALTATDDRLRVTGVTMHRRGTDSSVEKLPADLVVDAGGRGAHAGSWLEALGFPRAPEEKIEIGVGYTTRLYRRRPGDLPVAKAVIVAPTPPHERRLGVLFPIEGDRWMASLGGWLGEHAPADEAGFLAFAESLPVPDISTVIQRAEPVSDFSVHKFPSNLRRHYERLRRVPNGFLAIGDALCSFNPIYGQGMTACALEAVVLDECLRAPRDARASLPLRFYHRVAKIIDIPWQSAAGADFAYRGVEGVKAPGTDLINWYVAHVQRAVIHDRVVYAAFLEVMNLLKPPTSLFHPRVLWRVLGSTLSSRTMGRRRSPAKQAQAEQLHALPK
jgi:2-polyprenyl-6-methoxyphenol hydroxylase-like FAD-dependent oxidoreductase